MALTVVDEQQSWAVERAMRWEIQYSRFFAYLSLSSIKRNKHRGTWLSSATPTAILSLSADPSHSDFILTISFGGKILEQHYASKLRFSWPQLSCMSNVPQQSSRAVFVSYKDGASETQKFGLRFSTYYEVGEFVTMLEDGFSNKHEDFMTTTRSSQSEANNMSSEVVLTGASQILDTTPHAKDITASHSSEGYVPEISECYVPQISEGYLPVFPPRFTSFVTNCSEMAQGQAASTQTASHEVDLKSLIARYLEDASFLDILSKAEEVIAEMGGGMPIQQFL